MTTLHKIEELLNIEIGDKVLRNGRVYNDKNRYYWYRNEYYIVNIGDNKWCIMSSNETTREMLDDYIWECMNGYSISREGNGKSRTTVLLHRKLMNVDDSNIFIDHLKRNRYDNRLENLRIVTAEENSRNRTKPRTNTSGIMGIDKMTTNGHVYWRARICNDENKNIHKYFSINKLGDEQAKQQAFLQRNIWKEQFNYLGE